MPTRELINDMIRYDGSARYGFGEVKLIQCSLKINTKIKSLKNLRNHVKCYII